MPLVEVDLSTFLSNSSVVYFQQEEEAMDTSATEVDPEVKTTEEVNIDDEESLDPTAMKMPELKEALATRNLPTKGEEEMSRNSVRICYLLWFFLVHTSL